MSRKWALDLSRDCRSALRHFGYPVAAGAILELINYGIKLVTGSPDAIFSLTAVKTAAVLGATSAVMRLGDRFKADVKKWSDDAEEKISG